MEVVRFLGGCLWQDGVRVCVNVERLFCCKNFKLN